MIVDFHTHIFPEKIAASTIEKLENIANVRAFTDGKENSLVTSMEEAGVDLIDWLDQTEELASQAEILNKMVQKFELCQ